MSILLCMALALCLCSCGGTKLKCNFSSADISALENEHLVLAGFAAREGLSDGIHLPLKTNCLVVTDGRQKVCIVSSDLMEISPDLAGELRDSISARSGLDREHILLHCTHTHSAPRMGGVSVGPGAPNHDYRSRTFGTIVDNAVRTITDDAAFVPFSLEVAKGSASINYNRCEPESGPADQDLYAAKIISRGKPVCAFYNIACHPVSMGHRSLLLSSDYPGVARRIIADEWGCDIFQFTGAAGNMDPKGGCQLVDHAEEIGAELAESLRSLEFKKVKPTGVLKFETALVQLPYMIEVITPEAVRAHADSIAVAYKTEFPRFAEDVRNWESEILSRFDKGTVSNKLDFHIEALNIDGVILFFTQGEPFCEYQMTERAIHPDRTIFFTGYTNGQNSYLPSAHAYEYRKGYEYEIEQMHVYIKAPYPLSPEMPLVYGAAVEEIIQKVL